MEDIEALVDFAFVSSFDREVIIALIHWKILPTAEARNAFFDYWANTLKPPTGILAYEFLSRPMQRDEVPFPSGPILASQETGFESYVNVGIWESTDAFKREIYDRFGDRTEKKDFEHDLPERMILEPQHWHVGELSLPDQDK